MVLFGSSAWAASIRLRARVMSGAIVGWRGLTCLDGVVQLLDDN